MNTMISERFSILLRFYVTIAGLAGFGVGAAMAWIQWGQNTLLENVCRAAGICAISALITRQLLLIMFKAYCQQIKVRKEDEKKPVKAEPKKT